MKICSSCKQELDESCFYRSNGKPISECKTCRYSRSRRSIEARKDEVSSYQREYRKSNAAHILDLQRKRRDRNRAEYNAYFNKRWDSDINFKIAKTCRGRIYKALSRKSLRKQDSMHALIGCTIDALKYWLAYQFEEGMNWNNYGKWHIDHVVPCASFNLEDLEEQKKCFHWTNLQPLWAKDNLSKGAKYV